MLTRDMSPEGLARNQQHKDAVRRERQPRRQVTDEELEALRVAADAAPAAAPSVAPSQRRRSYREIQEEEEAKKAAAKRAEHERKGAVYALKPGSAAVRGRNVPDRRAGA